MAVMYLVDTNIVSEMMRSHPNKTVQRAWKRHAHEIAVASVSWHELLAGTYRLPPSKRRSAFENFLHGYLKNIMKILPYTQASAEWHALERVRLSRAGRTPSFADGQIAAIAMTHQLILVTRNVKDFAHFSDLTVENWFDEASHRFQVELK